MLWQLAAAVGPSVAVKAAVLCCCRRFHGTQVFPLKHALLQMFSEQIRCD